MGNNSSFGLMTFVRQKFATILDAPVEIKEEIKEIKERFNLFCSNRVDVRQCALAGGRI